MSLMGLIGLMGLISLMGIIGLMGLSVQFPVLETRSSFLAFDRSVEQVVGEGYANAGRAYPSISVLPFLEEIGIQFPFIIVQVILFRRVNRALKLIGVVLAAEESELCSEL